MGPLLAGTLGVALWGGALGQETQREIIVTAPRISDEVLTAQVAAALQEDAYLFADHVTVTAQSGVVHIRGRVSDLSDLFAILRLARRIAGKGRVANEIEFVPIDFDGD
jgi:osmotically-inducible protein OsmY